MLIRVAFFVLMALGLIGFGTVAWITTRPPTPVVADGSPPPPPVAMTVLVTAHPLHAGSLLKPEDLVAKSLPTNQLPADTSPDSPESRRLLVGAMVRRPLSEGEPLRAQDIMKPGEHGFLAAVLEPGARAVTIPVDATSGIAGLIWPGDRVDLILTQANGDASVPLGQRVGAETVLSNVRVIAIDQQLMQGASTANDGQARTVTLEVDGDQAQRVAVAMRLGQLSLSVRSASPDTSAARTGTSGPATWAKDVLPSLLTDRKAPTEATIRVYGGNRDAKEFNFP
jgi:pilus assembly protein CpaB